MKYIALLRAANTGRRKVTMAELRAALADAGYPDAQTLQAAGSIVLETKKIAPAKLEAAIEKVVEDTFGVVAETMVRDPKEWADILAANPFRKDAEAHPNLMFTTVYKTAPDPALLDAYVKGYREKFGGREKVKLIDREIYIVFPDGAGKSEFLLPKKLGPCTARNWNTMQKLQDMLDA